MRRGVSLLEVLCAIGIVSIALLGVISVFVVAASTAKKGQVSDASALVGRKALADFRVRGMDRPHNWMIWDAGTSSYQPVPLAMVTRVGVNPATGLLDTMSSGFVMPPQGVAICIDPRFVASAAVGTEAQASLFPYTPRTAASDPRLARVTLADRQRYAAADSAVPMGRLMADALFVAGDDLTITRPKDGSIPAFGDFTQGHRQSEGNLSWIATLVPNYQLVAPIGQETLATPTAQSTNDYTLSVVVFHQRPSLFDITDTISERVAGVDWAEAGGSGFAGGETLLYAPTEDAVKVRAGDWIMLAGNYQHNLGGLLPVAKWFRVSEADTPSYHSGDNRWECYVSLAGGDWDVSGVRDQQAVIAVGAVAVFEKSIQMKDLH